MALPFGAPRTTIIVALQHVVAGLTAIWASGPLASSNKTADILQLDILQLLNSAASSADILQLLPTFSEQPQAVEQPRRPETTVNDSLLSLHIVFCQTSAVAPPGWAISDGIVEA